MRLLFSILVYVATWVGLQRFFFFANINIKVLKPFFKDIIVLGMGTIGNWKLESQSNGDF